MSIGNEIDKTIEKLREARKREYTVIKVRCREAYDIYRQFYSLIDETKIFQDTRDATWEVMGYEVYIESLGVTFKNIKTKRSAEIGFSSTLYEQYRGSITRSQVDEDLHFYAANGDEAILEEIYSIYPTMILEILRRSLDAQESEADKSEAKREVGLRAG
jgi:hypothetical protein